MLQNVYCRRIKKFETKIFLNGTESFCWFAAKPNQRTVDFSNDKLTGEDNNLTILTYYILQQKQHRRQCDQKKSPDNYKSCLKMISLEK